MADNDDTEREHTTVVETGGGGGGGVLAVVLLIIVVLVLLFLFRGQLGLGGSKTTVAVPDKIDVNARCLDGVDPETLRPRTFDGKNWEAAQAASRSTSG